MNLHLTEDTVRAAEEALENEAARMRGIANTLAETAIAMVDAATAAELRRHVESWRLKAHCFSQCAEEIRREKRSAEGGRR